MLLGTRGQRIVQVKPALDAPVNKGHLCVKGRYAFAFTHAADRIIEPMIREEVLAKLRAARGSNAAFSFTPALRDREKTTPSLGESSRPDNPERNEPAHERRALPPPPELS